MDLFNWSSEGFFGSIHFFLPYYVICLGRLIGIFLLFFSLYKIFKSLWLHFNSFLSDDSSSDDSLADASHHSFHYKFFIFLLILSFILLWFFSNKHFPARAGILFF